MRTDSNCCSGNTTDTYIGLGLYKNFPNLFSKPTWVLGFTRGACNPQWQKQTKNSIYSDNKKKTDKSSVANITSFVVNPEMTQYYYYYRPCQTISFIIYHNVSRLMVKFKRDSAHNLCIIPNQVQPNVSHSRPQKQSKICIRANRSYYTYVTQTCRAKIINLICDTNKYIVFYIWV